MQSSSNSFPFHAGDGFFLVWIFFSPQLMIFSRVTCAEPVMGLQTSGVGGLSSSCTDVADKPLRGEMRNGSHLETVGTACRASATHRSVKWKGLKKLEV